MRDPLLHALKDPNISVLVRSNIPKALTKIDPESESIQDAILRRAQDPKEDVLVRFRSVQAFKTFQNANTLVKPALESLAENGNNPIKVEAILQLGALSEPDPKVWDALFEMANGKYGEYLNFSSGASSRNIYPKSSAISLLVEKGKGEGFIPIFLKDLKESSRGMLMTTTLLQRVLVGMGEDGKEYVPDVIESLGHIPPSSSSPVINQTRFMLMLTLMWVDPLSTNVTDALKGIQAQDPYNQQYVEKLLECVTFKGDPERKHGVLCGDPKRYATASSP